MNHSQQLQQTAFRKQRYQNALALNNLAVRLMQRDCIAHAKECWWHAMRLMHSVLSGVCINSGEEVVKRATLLLHPNNSNSNNKSVFQVLTTLQYDSFVLSDGIAKMSPSALVLVCLEENLLVEQPTYFDQQQQHAIIKSNNTNCTFDFADILVEQVAVMSHNLATACLYQSQKTTTTTTTLGDKHAQEQLALHLCWNAYAVLLQSIQQQQHWPYRRHNLPVLIWAVLNSLVHILEDLSLLDYDNNNNKRGEIPFYRTFLFQFQALVALQQCNGQHACAA